MRSTSSRRACVRRLPRTVAINHPTIPPIRGSECGYSSLATSFLPGSLMPIPASRQPRHAHRQLRLHHLKLAPSQLHISRRQWHVVTMAPLRLNHRSWGQRQKVAHTKLAHRHGHVQLYRQSRHQWPERGPLVLWRPRRRNQRLSSLRCWRICGSGSLCPRLFYSCRQRTRRHGKLCRRNRLRCHRNCRCRRSLRHCRHLTSNPAEAGPETEWRDWIGLRIARRTTHPTATFNSVRCYT